MPYEVHSYVAIAVQYVYLLALSDSILISAVDVLFMILQYIYNLKFIQNLEAYLVTNL